MRVRKSDNKIRVTDHDWYFKSASKPTQTMIPIVEATITDAIQMIAETVGKSPATVRGVVYTCRYDDGIIDVSAFGHLVRIKHPEKKTMYAKKTPRV